MEFAELIKGKIVNFTGRLFSSEHNRWLATDNTPQLYEITLLFVELIEDFAQFNQNIHLSYTAVLG